MRYSLPLLLGISLSPVAAGTREPVQRTSTERVILAPGATLRLEHSVGSLTVEGWDAPEFEITITRSTERYYQPDRTEAADRLEHVRVMTQRRSDRELVVSTLLPHRKAHMLPPWPLGARAGAAVEYQIHVPRDTRLVVHHGGGQVLIANLAGEIEATNSSGDIVVMLPRGDPSVIDAKSRFGVVSSDFGDAAHRWYRLGQWFASPSQATTRRIYARVRWGSIVIKEYFSESNGNADRK